MKKSDFGDILEVVIILAVLVAGLFYTAYGLFDTSSVSGSQARQIRVNLAPVVKALARGQPFDKLRASLSPRGQIRGNQLELSGSMA
ncbi:MAG: hypothetical protein UX55_C0020G0013 [Candidatus Azambacteria bacterium GW2011_GWE2_46_45]|uniref:Uncharacterized protein n=1 Tax=Candidatus Azambacteria bacterium GW2011_GWE2_46_45 TaxID=1618625 RepID=A0A0G1T3F1_9BACT|nr:MAG: hypothetical protein UX55_C0020G0013 [Candidatus Azambacteria bacterium GW2011_GWE2_46_45]